VAAVLGEFLHLKPVISVGADGKYFTYCKAKGRKKSIQKLVEIVENAAAEKEINLAVVHGGAQEEFQKLVDRMRKIPNIKELVSSDISPALGVHTGPGLLGVCFHEV
jgi:fatty acid-binding protein DegV